MMLSSGRTVRWMLSGAGYLCRTAGYLYTRLGWFQPHVHASSLPLCPGCHGPFVIVYLLSTLCMCRACATSSFCPLCTPAQPSSCSTVVLSRSISLVVPLDCRGAPPVPCMQMCYRHLCSREHTLSASRAAGGESPLLCREVPRTLAQTPQLERQGGNRPL